MTDSIDGLLARIRLGEDQRLELKEVRFAGARIKGPDRSDLADEIAAMANATGGTLVVGASDKTREITGIDREHLDLVERYVRELVVDLIEPPLYPTIEKVEIVSASGEPCFFVRMEIPRSLFIHRGPRGYFYRVGSAKRPMNTEYLARMVQQRSQARLVRFDEQAVTDASPADLALELIDRFRTERTVDDTATLTRKLAMTTEDYAGTLRPTVAGLLLGSHEPQVWLRHAYIQAVAYRGEEVDAGVGYQLDARDCSGPLDLQVIEGCRFVARNMRVEASKRLGRIDLPQYDMTAVFEALVNAVVHRDYSMYGTRIRLRMFSNRIELSCPGPLANTMSVDSLAFRQSCRNEAIASLMARIPVPTGIPDLRTSRATMMDRRGEGVRTILERSEALSGKSPVYRMIDQSELLLTIPAASALEVHAGPDAPTGPE